MATLLELLHPNGVAPSVLVFGNNCPPDALACPRSSSAGAPADLIVITPDTEQAASPKWIAETAAAAARLLEDDGVLYAAAPPRARWRLVRALQHHGLAVDRAYLQHPGWPDGNVLIPVTHPAIAYAYTKLITTRRWRRSVALGVLRLPLAIKLLKSIAPSAGIVLRRRNASPLARWFLTPANGTGDKGDLLLNASWRGSDGAVVLVRFPGRATPPDAIGKSVLSGAMAQNYEREAEKLRELAAPAIRAGANLPVLLTEMRRGPYPVLVESLVPGVPARPLLEREPARLRPLMEQLAGWLGEWNRLTRQDRRLSKGDQAEFWLEPAQALAPALPNGAAYLEWLAVRTSQCLNAAVPFVAVHNDLTTMNVMVEEDAPEGPLGIIDWEAARAGGLPLTDFFYSVVDAVMYAAYPGDRPAAFEACFEQPGSHTPWVAELRKKVSTSLGLSADLDLLSFHACWLYHARAELESGLDGAHPFLSILNRAAGEVLAREVSAV